MNEFSGQKELLAIRTLRIAVSAAIRRHELGATPETGIALLEEALRLTREFKNPPSASELIKLEQDTRRWIPIIERLPEGEEVLYWDGETISTFFPETGEEEINQAQARCEDFGITHWMPFPEPPSVPDAPKPDSKVNL